MRIAQSWINMIAGSSLSKNMNYYQNVWVKRKSSLNKLKIKNLLEWLKSTIIKIMKKGLEQNVE